ncbi:MAG: MaoC family dehydratase N-terminal domain-containing protein [Dehalococcoidia bacterium]|jgi:acyl dehydratase|nr:MaoC family dehydratase N-terminal domain-containing protein [Dehalococcoidia bacterium]MDP6783747.1 MaoC family dehydratase N-terminal domain-containing protein [Dehalococcoidia bacterium]
MAQVYDVFNDVAMETLRRMKEVPLRATFPYHEVATKDAIRHFAFGYRDTNPLWTDEEYASGTRYGGIVAPPTFLCSCQSGIGGAANM